MTRESSGQSSPENAGLPEAVSRVEHEAIQWVVRMTSGEATAAERAAFRAWRAQTPEHEAALAAARRLWLGVGDALPARAKPPAPAHWRLLALAASLLVVAVLGYRTFGLWGDEAAGAADPRGGVAASETSPAPAEDVPVVAGDAAGGCRLVLGSGEASFDVMPNPDGPLGRSAGETQVHVSDTAFSLRPEAAGVLVTVTVGRVEVNDRGAERVLGVGQQLRCRAARHEAVFRVDPDAAAKGRSAADPPIDPKPGRTLREGRPNPHAAPAAILAMIGANAARSGG